jgi:hypothetical protein
MPPEFGFLNLEPDNIVLTALKVGESEWGQRSPIIAARWTFSKLAHLVREGRGSCYTCCPSFAFGMILAARAFACALLGFRVQCLKQVVAYSVGIVVLRCL